MEMKRVMMALALAATVGAVMPAARAEVPAAEFPPPPPNIQVDYTFTGLDQASLKALVSQGCLIIVRQTPDHSLINLTAGRLVNAPADVVWKTITDLENWPKFVEQTKAQKIIDKTDANHLLISQTLAIKIWRLPSIDVESKQVYVLTPPNRIVCWHVEGSVVGSYAAWDIVPSGNQTLIFYTIYTNLTNMGMGLGSVFKAEPDFMAGINVTTAMLTSRCMQEEAERRAKP